MLALVGTTWASQMLRPDGNPAYGVVRVAGEFIAGCALSHIFRSGITHRFPWQYIVPLAITAILVDLYFALPVLGWVAYWCVPFLGILVLGLAHHRCLLSSLCSTRPLLFAVTYPIQSIWCMSYV